MRTSTRYIFSLFSLFMVLTGCDDKEAAPDFTGDKSSPIFSAIIDDATTRAVDARWEAKDEIGISGAGRTNVSYLTESGDGRFAVKKSGEQIYFNTDNETTFTAYYPWNDLSAGSTIKADTKEQDKQKKFDFLWATASGKKSDPKINFSFSHKMVKVELTMRPGVAMTYEELKSARFSLDGFRGTGSFNTADGTTTAEGAAEVWDFTSYVSFNDTDKTVKVSFIFFPQQFQNPLEFVASLSVSPTLPISLKAPIDFTGANSKKDGVNAKNEWKEGRQYNLSLTLSKTAAVINDCSINPWNVVSGDDITVD